VKSDFEAFAALEGRKKAKKRAVFNFFARKSAKSWQKICGNEKKAIPLHPISKMIR